MTDVQLMRRAATIAKNTKCWIGIGCVIAKEGKILVEAWNETLRGEAYCQRFRASHKKKKHDSQCTCENEGCDRQKLGLSGGKDTQIACSIHAEALAIARAAQKGIGLEGVIMFVTSFPCLICMRSIISAGVKKVFYMNDFYKPQDMELFEKNRIRVQQLREEDVWRS